MKKFIFLFVVFLFTVTNVFAVPAPYPIKSIQKTIKNQNYQMGPLNPNIQNTSTNQLYKTHRTSKIISKNYNEILEHTRFFIREASFPKDKLLLNSEYIQIATKTLHKNQWLNKMQDLGIALFQFRDKAFIRFEPNSSLIYNKLIYKLAENTPISPFIIKHLIKKESNGNERARSCANAFGITQTLPIVIRDIVKMRKELGSNQVIQNKIMHLEKQLRTKDKQNIQAKYIHKLNRLKILALIPEFCIEDDFSFPKNRLLIDKKGTRNNVSTGELFALMHGPLNILFGMVHLALNINTIEYYKATGKIDINTNSLLAAQLAYNCGLSRTVKRISSLGGWKKIFDVPNKINGKRSAYLPNETANYGYLFIKSFLLSEQNKQPIFFHPDKNSHYRLCLVALKRSHEYQAIIKTLKKKDLTKKALFLETTLRKLIENSNSKNFNAGSINNLIDTIRQLPNWPLIEQVENYTKTILSHNN